MPILISCNSEKGMERFCLKAIDFDTSIRDYFSKLREDQRLFDVTLASDDGQLIKAHKIVLSAGSDFFSNIFQENNDSNMVIYMKGVSSVQLEHVTNFMYKGEVFITQEELEQFLVTGKELQINGLLDKLQEEGMAEDRDDKQKIFEDNLESEIDPKNKDSPKNLDKLKNTDDPQNQNDPKNNDPNN